MNNKTTTAVKMMNVHLFLFLFPLAAFSQGNFRSNANGDWGVASSWTLLSGTDADGIPDANDDATIEGRSITMNAASGNQACNNLTIQVTSTTAADGGLTVSGSILSVGGNANFQRVGSSANFHCDLQVSGTGIVSISGNFLASRSATDTRDRRLRIYLLNTGRMDVAGMFSYNYLNDREAQTEILLENSGQLNVTGAFTIFYGDASGNNIGSDLFLINFNGGGSITCGNFSASISGTNANAAADIFFLLDGGSMTTNNFSISHNGPSDDIRIMLNSVSTANPSSLTVNGNFSINHSSTNGDDIILQTNNNSSVAISGTATFNVNSSSDMDQIFLDMNGGTMSVGGTATFYVAAAVTNSSITISVNQATLNLNGGLILRHYGGGAGDIMMYVNNTGFGGNAAAGTINITGDWTIDHQLGDDMIIETNNNSTITATGSLFVNAYSVTGNDVLYFRVNNGVININGDMVLDFFGGGTLENMNVRVNNSGQFNIGNDAIWTMTTGGDIIIYLNNTSGTNAEFNVGRDFTIDHSGSAADIIINPRESSQFTVGGNFTVTHGASGGDYFHLTMDNTPTVDIGGDFSVNMTSGVSANDEIIIDINGGSFSADNISLIKSAGNQLWWDMDGGIANISGDFTVSSNGGAENRIDIDNASIINIGGDLMYDLNATTANTNTSRIYVNNNVAGTGGQLNIGGNLIVDHEGAAADMEFYLNRDAQVNVTGDVVIDNDASGGDFFELQLANNTNSFSAGGNFTMNLNSGVIGTADDAFIDVNGGTFSVGGNITIAGTAGDDAYFTVDNSAVASVGGNFWLDHNGGDLSYIYLGRTAGSPTLTINGNLLLDDAGGGTTELETNQNSVANVRGSISLIAAAASQTLIDLNNTSTLRIGGNFSRAASPSMFGTLDATTGAIGAIVKYDGSSAQIIAQDAGSGGDFFRYGGITVDNSSSGAGPHLTMEGAATVNGNLLLTDGIVQTTSSNLLIVADNATSSSGSVISFVDGPMKKIGNDAFAFPVGDIVSASDVWARLAMTAPGSVASQFTAEYFGAGYSDLSVDATINNTSGIEYWRLDRIGSASTVNVTLYWEDATRSAITDAASSDLVVARYNGSDWTTNGQTSVTGLSPGTVASSLVTTYNTYFTFASVGGVNPLPVEWLSFEVKAEKISAELIWSTASESGSDYFAVEKSQDGISFEEVGRKAASGYSSVQKNYSFTDTDPFSGISYYRLKQMDFDGQFSYSKIEKVFFQSEQSDMISVFPNPATEIFFITFSSSPEEDAEVSLVDMFGRKCFSEIIPSGTNQIKMTNDGSLPAGIYIVSVKRGKGITQGKLILR